MKTILFFTLVVLVSCQTIKKADKVEYEKYLEYCNKSVMMVQYGHVTLKMIETPGDNYGLCVGHGGEYNAGTDTVWFSPYPNVSKFDSISKRTITHSYMYEQNQKMVGRKVTVNQRKPSKKDFYDNWKRISGN